MSLLIVVIAFFFIFSLLVTGIVREYNIRRSILDIPNTRSLHTTPIPRGGGLSITLSVFLCATFLYSRQLLQAEYCIALLGGGFLVAAIGWLDDCYNLPAKWRAVAYVLASIWAVYWVGGLKSISVGEYSINVPVYGNIIAVALIAWLINLYNFMDGSDGLAGIQACCAGLMSGILYLLSGQLGLAILTMSLATASAGFLFWNWPPAKIFMGDVGSCMIGFCFGFLMITGENSQVLPAIVWVVLLGLFIGDATLTLIMRIFSKEKWYVAHKSHAYQRTVQMGISHKQLTMAVLLINILILWPAAYLVYRQENFSIILTVVIFSLICILWVCIQVFYRRNPVPDK